jgi:hypothetical protein
MPELVQESSSPSAVPPVIDPAEWESFPLLRESAMLYVSEPQFNAALRTTAEHFFRMVLETYDRWPAWPESSTRMELRALVADLRHAQGCAASIGQERHLSSLPPADAKLAKYASEIARVLNRAANGIERKLAKGAQS